VDAWEDYASDVRRRRFNPLPPDESERRGLVADAVKADLGVLSRALAVLPFFRHQSLLSSLSGPRLEQRTLTRLGVEAPPPMPPPLPPPLPPEGPAAPAPLPLDDPKDKKSGCSEWCVGCPGLCCCGTGNQGRTNRVNCCDGIYCCDCSGCDCSGCDCDCPCDC
jgi:hypothetical protein